MAVDSSVDFVRVERIARLAGVGEVVVGGTGFAVAVKGGEGGYRMGNIRVGQMLRGRLPSLWHSRAWVGLLW